MTPTLLGALVVTFAGLAMGSVYWPVKVMRRFQFEHWFFVAMFVGLIIVPWTTTLLFCPNAIAAYHSVPLMDLLKSNLFAIGWGVASVLGGLCIARIGIGLTTAILTAVGVSIGVTLPMVVKGSGLFNDAAGLGSPAGHIVLIGVGIMLLGVVLVALAGFGRDRVFKSVQKKSGGFLLGLIMSAIGGILSAGISFSFVYGQGPIVEAMKINGAGEIPANFAVWAAGLVGGSIINIAYPAYLMSKRRSWNVLWECKNEIALAAVIGVQFTLAIVLMGRGMLLLGALGASIGFGMQQAAQIIGGQAVGFASGEWRGVAGTPRWQMYLAIATLVTAAAVMAFGDTLAKS
ncbi:MAG: hypothetical protein HYX78_05945 [Armatimonadetes bacterium]|nr:hypothetical protein [Armatimonadota bacterium]